MSQFKLGSIIVRMNLHFEDDVGTEESCQRDVESIAGEEKIFFHAQESGISHVRAINECHQIDEDSTRKYSSVEFVPQRLLNLQITFLFSIDLRGARGGLRERFDEAAQLHVLLFVVHGWSIAASGGI
jgi:hypothetical protein